MKSLGFILAFTLFATAAFALPAVSDEWSHVSETSAVIYWQTDEPTESYIEYGPDQSFSMQTTHLIDNSIEIQEPMAHHGFFTHIHHLTGLQRSTQYNYRLVMIDSTGESHRSVIKSFTTQDYPTKLDVLSESSCQETSNSGDPNTYQYCLDNDGATYVLSQDITASAGGIWIRGNDITLDLDGHTVTYNNVADGTTRQRLGIYVYDSNMNNVRILNGFIKQGAGNDAGSAEAIGHNPMYVRGGENSEIAGLHLEWSGPQVTGLYYNYGGDGSRIHHNILHDTGTVITNRHQQVKAILVPDSNIETDHNLIQRSRHAGIITNGVHGGTSYNNEIYMDSWATNAIGINFPGGSDGFTAYKNRIFGFGYHAEALYPSGDAANGLIYDNYAELWATQPNDRSTEYGTISSMNGLRVMWGTLSNVTVRDNTFVVHAANGGRARGTQIYQNNNGPMQITFVNNTIISYGDTGSETEACAITAEGDQSNQNPPQLIYRDNIIISDTCNVRFGTSYGIPKNTFFTNNIIRKIGSKPFYHTVQIGWGAYSTYDHVFLDNLLEGGASMRSVDWTCEGTGYLCEYTAMWTLTVNVKDGNSNPVEGMQLSIEDAAGFVWYDSIMPSSTVVLELPEFVNNGTRYHAYDTHELSPYTLTLSGVGVSQSVVLDSPKTVDLVIDQLIPIASDFECELNSPGNWQDCANIKFGDTLRQVRATCIEGDNPIQNAEFKFENLDDNKIIFQAFQSGSNPITIDLDDLSIEDSGTLREEVKCHDTGGMFGQIVNEIGLPWGEITLQHVAPADGTIVSDGDQIEFTVQVSCQTGECGDMQLTLDPQIEIDARGGSILEDTYSRSGGSTNGYGESSYGIVSGYHYSTPYRAWFKIDISQVPIGSTIQSASLNLYHYNDEGSHNNALYTLSGSAHQDWNQGGLSSQGCFDHVHGTYGAYCPTIDQVLATGIAPAGADDADYWQEFPISQISWLQDQVDAGLETITLVVERSGDNDGASKFDQYYSSEHSDPSLGPRLSVTYEPPGYKGGVIPMNTGTPFYTTTQNPATGSGFSCLRSMVAGDLCEVSWNVFTNADEGTYNFYAFAEPITYPVQGSGGQSGNINIIVGACQNQLNRFDSNPCNGRIDLDEVVSAIGSWYAGSATLSEMVETLKIWKDA